MWQSFLYFLFNILIFLYQTIAFSDLGVAIILLTILIRLALVPLFYKGAKSQMIMQKIQPKLQQIQHDHKDNKEKQAQAMMELYKQHKVNPFSGILLLFAQLPVFIALYSLFINFSKFSLDNLYGFVSRPDHLQLLSFDLIDLRNSNIIIVGLAALAQYFQGYLTLPKSEPGKPVSGAEKIGKQMVFMGPIITLVILWKLPAAIGIYWLTNSIFSVAQQIYINKKVKIDV
ncbi:MAG: preprotein translocase subunit YidC [Parcubacteria group bacterium Athens0714_26]|nr:MAG: preprotein translocase subunit YidC [Parcubacteria group bacterium Athens1014_26]TSD02391.1 MAG: preprotein translocase subunit YidC [Parcubacteria group bacterium Athens0714_26]